MNEPFEYCPVKSAGSKAWHSPSTWVFGSFVLGALFMYALGKVSDIEKVVWFAAGTAITAAATAYQSYQSNRRAADERKFTEGQQSARMEFEKWKYFEEHTVNLRIRAYESLLQASCDGICRNHDDEALNKFVAAYSLVRLVGDVDIAGLSGNLLQKMLDIRRHIKGIANTESEKKELDEQFGALCKEITSLMRDDIGRSTINLRGPSGSA